MSDGSPVLGPKVARPNQGPPRNDPGIEQSMGSNGLPGIVVMPWRLVKESAYRTASGTNPSNPGSTVTFQIPIDVGFVELD